MNTFAKIPGPNSHNTIARTLVFCLAWALMPVLAPAGDHSLRFDDDGQTTPHITLTLPETEDNRETHRAAEPRPHNEYSGNNGGRQTRQQERHSTNDNRETRQKRQHNRRQDNRRNNHERQGPHQSGPYEISGVSIVDINTGRTLPIHTVDLKPTLDRIRAGIKNAHRNDGTVFRNSSRNLPGKPRGYYREYVVPTPGVRGPGPQRLVVGRNGEIYYTHDHYDTFIKVERE